MYNTRDGVCMRECICARFVGEPQTIRGEGLLSVDREHMKIEEVHIRIGT